VFDVFPESGVLPNQLANLIWWYLQLKEGSFGSALKAGLFKK
jgi:hypothetical protein